MGLFDFFKKNTKTDRVHNSQDGPTLNEPEYLKAEPQQPAPLQPEQVTHSYSFNIGEFDAGILVADLSQETGLPQGVNVTHEDSGIRISAPDKEIADMAADTLSQGLNELMARSKIMKLTSATPEMIQALDRAIANLSPPAGIQVRFLQERVVVNAPSKDQAEEWFQKAIEAMTTLLTSTTNEDAIEETEPPEAPPYNELTAPPPIDDGDTRCSFCSQEILHGSIARQNRETQICTNCLNMSRKVLDQAAPMAANNIRIKAMEEGKQPCSFCNAYRYRFLVVANPSTAICDSCVDTNSPAVQNSPDSPEGSTDENDTDGETFIGSATADNFNSIRDGIQEQIQSGALNIALTGLHRFLGNSPGHEAALKFAAIALNKGMRRTNPHPIKPELASAKYFDPVFAQCDTCGECWVPNPSSKYAAQASLAKPIGGLCPECHQVICRKHLQNKFSCPTCNCELEPVRQPNGRARIRLLHNIIELTPEKAAGKKHALILGSGFMPSLNDIELIEGAGYLSRASIGMAFAGSHWGDDSEQGRSQALTLWTKYNEDLHIDMGRSQSEDLVFDNGRCFYIFKHPGLAMRVG